MEPILYRVTTAMKKLNVCRATIYRMAARGELELVRIGQRATRITAESIDRAIAAGKSSSEDRPSEKAAPGERQRKGGKSPPTLSPENSKDHEARITALEREVTALRKLITKFNEATDECTKTLSAPASRHRGGRPG